MAVKRTSTNILVALVLAAGIICLSSAAKQAENLFAGQLPSQVPFQEAESLRFEVNWKPLFLLPAFQGRRSEFFNPSIGVSPKAHLYHLRLGHI